MVWRLVALAAAAAAGEPRRRDAPLDAARLREIAATARRLEARGNATIAAGCATRAPAAAVYHNVTPTCYLVPPPVDGAAALVYWHVPKAASSTTRRALFGGPRVVERQ